MLADNALFLNEFFLLVGVGNWPAGSVLANNALFLNKIVWVPVPGWLAGRLTQKIEPEIDIKKAISKH